jgi:hypothetical protein
MISEQGPARPDQADDAPTEIIQAIGTSGSGRPPGSWPPEARSRGGAPQHRVPVRSRERRQLKLSAVLAVIIFAVLGIAAYKVASGAGGKTHVAAAASTSAVSHVSSAPVSPSASPTSASPSPSPSPSPAKSASVAVATQLLRPASASAVGPGGAAGDDPGAAGLAIDGNMSTAWTSDWYDTPEFGGLQTGTGLLVDMGRTVTITSVQVTLQSESGADLQVRAGNSSVTGLPTVAAEYGQGGTVQLKLATPVRARYVLIWFTELAPDGTGTYQVKVYNISVTGQP